MSIKNAVVIGGITGLRNRGVDALLRSILYEMGLVNCYEIIYVHTNSKGYDQRVMHDRKLQFIQDFLIKFCRTKYRKAIIFGGGGILVSSVDSQLKTIEESNAYIFSGGDLLSSEYESSIHGHLSGIEYAQKKGKKSAIYAQSIGPFKKEESIKYVKKILINCNFVSVREYSSWRYLSEDLGLDGISFTPDPAFLLSYVDEEDSSPYDKNNYYTIGIGLNDSLKVFGGDKEDNHFESLKGLILRLLKVERVKVLLIPHVQEIYDNSDDRLLAHELKSQFKNDDRIVVIDKMYSSIGFKSIIKGCDLVFAERMHVGVASSSLEIPTVFIKYSMKAEGMARLVYGEDKELLDRFLVEEFDLDKINEKYIGEILDLETRVKEKLRETVPKIKEQTESGFKKMQAALGV